VLLAHRAARHAAQAGRAGRRESGKVVYRLVDPANSTGGQAVLVVGGGDSALEAARGAGRAAGHGGDAVAPQRGVLARQGEEPPGPGAAPRGGALCFELEWSASRTSVRLKAEAAP
jgi:hypothetical protein